MKTSKKPGENAGPASPRSRLVEIAIGAVWLVGLGAALQLAELALGRSPLGAALAGAVIADVVAGFAGVRWDEAKSAPAPGSGAPERASAAAKADPGYSARTARAVGIGMGISLGVMAVTIVLSAAVGWARVEGGHPGSSLIFALLRGTALGARDELWLRGIVLLAARRARVPELAGALVAALAGGAAIAFAPDATAGAVVLAIGSGWLFAALWLRFRGAWAAVGAHAFWLFLVGPGLRGGILETTWITGALHPPPRSSGAVAFVAAALLAAAGVAVLRWKRSPSASARKKDETAADPA